MSEVSKSQIPNLSQRLIFSVLRFVAAGIFLVAAFSKIFSFSGLVFTMTRLGWFSSEIIPILAVFVIVAELTTGCWLLSSQAAFVSWGSLVGMGLALIFVAVHTTFLTRGVTQVCSCLGLLFQPSPSFMLGLNAHKHRCHRFGQRSSPSFMLGLNAVLFAVCGIVFVQSRKLASSSAPSSPLLSVRGQFVRGVFCALLLFASALQVGHNHQIENQADSGAPAPKLHYGQMAPGFTLRLADGKMVSPRTLGGKWTLLSFVQTNCEPCHDDLNDLANWYPKQHEKVNALVIVMGSGLLQSPQTTAQRFAQNMHLPLLVACDADRSVSKRYMGARVATPFHVLLDDKSRVRMVELGRNEIETNKRSALIQMLDDTINGIPMEFEQRAFQSGGAHGQPVSDGKIYLQGKEVKLSDLWRRGPVVLSFAVLECHGCDERLANINRAVNASPKVQVIQLYSNPSESRIAVQRHGDLGRNILIGADMQGALARKYSVQFAPSTFVIVDGKMQHAASERASPFDLERAVAQLSTSSDAEENQLRKLRQLVRQPLLTKEKP